MPSFLTNLALLCALASCASCGKPESEMESKTNLESLPISNARSSSSQTEWLVGLPGVKYKYSDLFSRDLIYSNLEQGVDVFTKENFGDVIYTWQVSFSTSFGIESIRGRSSEDYVIAGYDELSGETVIEGWSFTTLDGAYFARRLPATTGPIGTAIPLSVYDVDIEGPAFIQPSERVMAGPPQKAVLYRGAGVRIRNLLVDPEGRYLIVQDDVTGGIYQVVNQQMNLLAGPQTYPALSFSDNLDFYQDGTQDRVLALMVSGYSETVLVLYDSENDGIFEFVGMDTLEGFNATFPCRGWDGIEARYKEVR